MSEKQTITTISQTTNETSFLNSLNSNFALINDALEDCVSRKGTAPNYLTSAIDLNGVVLFNAGTGTNPTDVATLGDYATFLGDAEDARDAAIVAKNAALVAQAAAETAETNAQTAETNAETAETNAENARDSILNDVGFIAVSADLAGANTIGAVATIAADVSTVAADVTNVSAVAQDLTNIDTLVADLTNVDTVATSILDVSTVATNIADVSTVAGIATDITTVAADATDIGTVAGIATDVTSVATIDSDITAVAVIAAEVTSVAAITADIATVAAIDSDVTSVAAIDSDVTTVAAIDSDVTTVATNAADVTTCATNIAAIIAAPQAASDAEDARDLAQGYAAAANVDKIEWQGTWSAGTYAANDAVEKDGTSYIATTSTSETPSISATDWDILALKGTNGTGSGDVMGPAANTADYIPQWNGANSKTLKDGLAVPTGGLAGLTALGGKEDASNKATTFGVVNDTLYPSVKAVNDAIIAAVAGLLDYRGSYDAHLNTYPATGGSGTAGAILKGDFWICSVAGVLNSKNITAGDLIVALQDTPAQTDANWDLIEHDLGYAPVNKAGDTMTGDLAMGANNITLTGSIAATGNRVLKGWFTDLECTNDIAGATTGNAKLSVANTWTKTQSGTQVALTSTSNHIATNASLGNNFSHTMTEDTTLDNPSSIVAGTYYTWTITQHASSAKTLALGSYFKTADGAAFSGVSTTVGAVNTIYGYAKTTTAIDINIIKNGVA